MRPALAIAAAALAALACTSSPPPSCPGTAVGSFRFKGALVLAGDPEIDALDPVRNLPDCTPDPLHPGAIAYPRLLAPFDATLAADDASGAAALCRTNGVVLVGTRSGSSWDVAVDADPAVLCGSACGATLRAVVKGDVVPGAGGAPDAFRGLLVEVLTAARGACEGCLPAVPGATPPANACAARYALTGVAR